MGSLVKTLLSEVVSGLEVALRNQPDAVLLRAWHDIASGKVSFADYFSQMKDEAKLTCLTVDTTGACDLACAGMCYYHPDIPIHDVQVPFDSLATAIEDSWRLLNMKTLVVAGKEPFLNPRRLFALLEFAGSRPARSFSIGVVTNGRHIGRHWKRLAMAADQGNLDFVDVSLDSGIPAQHDLIRGIPGTYDLAISGLQRIVSELPRLRASICSILRADNPQGILELFRRQRELVRHFWIFPIQPPPFSLFLPLTGEFVVSFLRDMADLLAGELRDANLVISVPLQGLYLSEAARAGFVNWHAIREDGLGACYSPLAAGTNTIQIQCCVLPEQAARLGRITYTGDYLAQSHFLQTPNPSQRAVGNVSHEPIQDIYRKSKANGSILHCLSEARSVHECATRECWQHCFGGWSVAEQSLLDGTPLNCKPRLCTK